MAGTPTVMNSKIAHRRAASCLITVGAVTLGNAVRRFLFMEVRHGMADNDG